MFSFFRRSPPRSAFEKLGVDMHSHLLPGIDDGSPDIQTSLSLIQGLQSMGYEKIITTPHILADLYPNDSFGIKNGLTTLRAAMTNANLHIEVEAAAEYFVDRHLDGLIEANDILSFGQARFVLIEMSFVSVSPNLEDVIFALITKGYQPILAHPERYTYLINQKSIFARLTSLGCLMQVNILSLVGYYGKAVQSWAFFLIKANLVSFLGTDLHHKHHLELLHKHRFDSRLNDSIEKYSFRNRDLLSTVFQ
nr:CpsB/CapC family capsule biosynthesis tyrosine phosphatase [uncultured Dyadobacter sp.]